MKATGIVRRIDDLGRIVIPKEIRRSFRIREADPMEIYTGRDGEIILKKYSPIGEMTTFAKQYAESLSQVSGKIALITDREQFIAAAGGLKNLIGKALSRDMEQKLEKRQLLQAQRGEKQFLEIAEEKTEDVQQFITAPILSEGDVIGSVVLASKDKKAAMGEVEKKLVLSAAGFLGRQMES